MGRSTNYSRTIIANQLGIDNIVSLPKTVRVVIASTHKLSSCEIPPAQANFGVDHENDIVKLGATLKLASYER